MTHTRKLSLNDGRAVIVHTKTPWAEKMLRSKVRDWDDLTGCGVDFHNPEGPAVTVVQNTPRRSDGHQRTEREEWWIDGQRHRNEGPAVIHYVYGQDGLLSIDTEHWQENARLGLVG